MKQHSAECIIANEAYSKAVAAWIEAHPGYCETCQGWGGTYQSGDWVPYGMGSVQLPGGIEPCPDCIEKGLCPHCSTELQDEHCPACAWTWEDQDGIPLDPPGCICWENDDED